MNGQKPWYLSKGVWGGLVAACVGAASLFGIHIPEGEVASLTEAAMSVVTTVAGLFAVYGRIVASSKIG